MLESVRLGIRVVASWLSAHAADLGRVGNLVVPSCCRYADEKQGTCKGRTMIGIKSRHQHHHLWAARKERTCAPPQNLAMGGLARFCPMKPVDLMPKPNHTMSKGCVDG